MTDNKKPNNNLQHIRKEYDFDELDFESMNKDPLKQLENWLDFAIHQGVIEATAMMLATSNSHNIPDARIVLLKGIDSGLVFFTNYESKKGKDLTENPQACITFFWPELERQIRVQGVVEKVSRDESQAYFESRPLGSQLSAIVSPQSQVIDSITYLDQERHKIETEALESSRAISCPNFWGGFRLLPKSFEFWQGRPNRLHDRLCYVPSPTQNQSEKWKVLRKAP